MVTPCTLNPLARPSFLIRAGLAVATSAFALVTLAGCQAIGRKVDQAELVAFQPGVATCAQVVQRFGPPTNSTVTSDGTQQLTYSYQQMQINPVSFIPIASAFVRSADVEHTETVVTCDGNGVVQHFTSSQGQSTAGTGLISGAKQK